MYVCMYVYIYISNIIIITIITTIVIVDRLALGTPGNIHMLSPHAWSVGVPTNWCTSFQVTSFQGKLSGGNHLSNTTSLTQVFFKSGEQCSKLN